VGRSAARHQPTWSEARRASATPACRWPA
jgi:hypothetical protein